MNYTSRLDAIKIISIISLCSALIIYILLPESENIDNKILPNHVEISKQVITEPLNNIETSTSESCVDEVTNYHCLDDIKNKLASKNTIIKISGLNLLWRYIDEHYSDTNIELQLQPLKNDENFKVKDLAVFIVNKIEFLRDPEMLSKNSNAITSDNDSDISYQEMTESSSEANLSESVSEQLNENNNATLMDDNDVYVRMSLLEKIIVERTDDAIELVSKALNDSENDIRLTAVDGLGQFLTEGFGDPKRIVDSLQKSLDDQDTKIVELSQDLLTQYNNIKQKPDSDTDVQ
jgi:hypothetical protein